MSDFWNLQVRHGDLLFGVIGTGSTVGFLWVNGALAFVAGALTVGVMALRLRREWKHRNDPPED